MVSRCWEESLLPFSSSCHFLLGGSPTGGTMPHYTVWPLQTAVIPISLVLKGEGSQDPPRLLKFMDAQVPQSWRPVCSGPESLDSTNHGSNGGIFNCWLVESKHRWPTVHFGRDNVWQAWPLPELVLSICRKTCCFCVIKHHISRHGRFKEHQHQGQKDTRPHKARNDRSQTSLTTQKHAH